MKKKIENKRVASDGELDTPINWEWLEKQKPLTRKEQAALGLPTPEELAAKPVKARKITLVVDDEAVAYFKHEAKRFGTSYQRMMRNLLTSYAHGRTAIR